MRYGQLSLGRTKPAGLTAMGIRFFLAAALAAVQTPGGYAPFSLGLMAAAGAGPKGAAALAGAGAGAFLFLDFADALPFLATAVLILTAASACRETRLLDRPWFMPAAAAGMSLAVGGIYVAQSLSPMARLTPYIAASGLTGLSAWFLRGLFSPEGADRDGLLFLCAALALGLGDLRLLEASVGRALLCALLACAAYDRGALPGAAAGLGAGLTADLCAGGGGLFAAAYGLGGLLAGARNGGHRAWAGLAFYGGALLPLLTAPEAAGPLLLEASAGTALFLLLPGRLFGGKRVRKGERAARAETAAPGNRLKERLNQAAGALRDLYDSMGRGAPQPTDENPAIIFDRAAEQVCRGCALCDLCWQREYTATFNALNDATPYLLERGRAMAKDFPGYFADRCIHLQEFIAAINGELSAFLLRRQYRRQLEETRRSAKGQYAQLSELLTATAAGLEAVPVMGEGIPCRVGAVLRPKEGETVCGDTVVSFRREEGPWCLLLADGMGSGEAARKESALICRLLRQFLEAGVDPEAALKTLNAAMALRGAETGSFTTIDLAVFDGSSGSLTFYKYGAAPSYLKKGGVVRRITGGTLPAGLRGAPASPDVTGASLDPGGFAVMISDGVADPNRDDWLQNLLAGWEGDDPQVLASLILTESVCHEQSQDDRAVQVLHRPREAARGV